MLCLNGQTITMNAKGNAIEVSSRRTFTLCDCKTGEDTGKITHGTNPEASEKFSGRGLYVYGTCNLYGGSITGNNGVSGCGVYVSSGKLNLYGGAITGNTGGQYTYGGGVHVSGGTFTMSSGTITGNTITDGDGGGVYVSVTGTPTVSGGGSDNSVSFDSPELPGGFTASGNVNITGNKKGDAANNVYLSKDKTITICGDGLDGAASIGVTVETPPAAGGTPVTIATIAGGASCTDGNFSSDAGESYSFLVEGSEVKLCNGAAHSHSWTYALKGTDTIEATCACGANGSSVTIAAPTGSLTYNGKGKAAVVSGSFTTGEKTPAITYKRGSSPLSGAPTNAGTYTASITVGTATADVAYTITKAKLTITAKDHTITYGDEPSGNGVTYSGFVNGESGSVLNGRLTYTYGYTQYGPVGADGTTYAITPGGLSSNNYNITYKPGKLTVQRRVVTLTWNNTTGRVYGDGKGEVTATAGNLVNNNTISVTVSGNELTVGTHTAIATGLTGKEADNYQLPASEAGRSVTYTVAPATQTLIFPDGDRTKTYGDGNFTVTAAGAVEGSTVTYRSSREEVATVDISSGEVTIVGAGTAVITATAAATGSFSEATAAYTLTVDPKTLTAEDLELTGTFTKDYDGTVAAPDVRVQVKAGVLVGSDTLTITGTAVYNSKNVAEATTITFTPNAITEGNYRLAANQLVTAGASIRQAAQAALTITTTEATYGTDLLLATSGGNGDGAVTYTVTNGTGTADISGSTTVVFTPEDSINYAEAETDITVTIEKAATTGTPRYTPITSGGKTLLDAALTATDSTLTPNEGTLVWVDEDGNVLADDTVVEANATYTWRFTPTDTNYEVLTGTIMLYDAGYAVNTENTGNGTLTVSAESAFVGDIVTITVMPDSGYRLDKLTVTDQDGKELELTGKDGRYTFQMPASEVTVKATFVKEKSFFVDVPTDAYYYEAVKWAAENGITNGTDETHFSPNGLCSRAQAVTFLWRAAGSPQPESASMPFTDVPVGSYYYDAVLWAVENGIAKGTGNTTFSPDMTCSRAQAVTFLFRAVGKPVEGEVSFSDVPADSYYANAVAWAVMSGVTVGTGNGKFSPTDDCTRAQIVTFLYRAYQSR